MDSLDFSSVTYGLILPYGVALPLRNIHLKQYYLKLPLFYFRFFIIIISIIEYFNIVCYHIYEVKVYLMKGGDSIGYIN